MEKKVLNELISNVSDLNFLEVFKQISSAKCLAFDLGKYESRLIYFFEPPTLHHEQCSFESPKGLLRAVNFDNKYVDECIGSIGRNISVSNGDRGLKHLKVTGRGAEGCKKSLESSLGVTIEEVNDVDCLISGCNFVLKNIFDEAYQVDVTTQRNQQISNNSTQQIPGNTTQQFPNKPIQQPTNNATQQQNQTSSQQSFNNNTQILQHQTTTHGHIQPHDNKQHDNNTFKQISNNTKQQHSNNIQQQHNKQHNTTHPQLDNNHTHNTHNDTENNSSNNNDVKGDNIEASNTQPIKTNHFNPPIKKFQNSTNQNNSSHNHDSLEQNSEKSTLKNIPNRFQSSSSSSSSASAASLKFVNFFALSHYPYLLVDVGNTVNIYKVSSAVKYERVTHPSGDAVCTHEEGKKKYTENHKADGEMQDICQEKARNKARNALATAHHHAKLHDISNIFFTGDVTRWQHTSITHTINQLSEGKLNIMFLRHNDFLAVIGAFLRAVEDDLLKDGAFTIVESMALSNGMGVDDSCYKDGSQQVKSKVIEFILYDRPRVHCPVVGPSYQPDTFNLSTNVQARSYWMQCFKDAIHPFMERAVASQEGSADVRERGEELKRSYLVKMGFMEKNLWAFGPLTVRNLLVMREHYLREFHFVDPFYHQKQLENNTALNYLSKWLHQLQQLQPLQKWLMLVRGLLAGNVFDWGAKEIVALIQKGSFGFDDALASIPPQPWLVDDSDIFIEKIQQQGTYKCISIFVDNSGFDIVLGVFPFAREFLLRGSKVILCANSRPAINDVTYEELIHLANRIAEFCDVIKNGLSEGRLLLMESGQGSPCLDLRSIDTKLARMMTSVDLLLLEGMGRAVHTNLHATFLCPVIKVCVLKNRWVAERLGGRMFDAIFKFESTPLNHSS